LAETPTVGPALSEAGPGVSDARRRALGDWRRRSRRVAFLRRALPWLMVAIVVGVGGWIGVRALVSTLSQRAASSQIRMTNPRFFGRDDKGRSFVLTAREAARGLGDESRITLNRPGLKLDLGRPAPANAAAAAGAYEERTRILELNGNVVFEDGRGNKFTSSRALIDTKTGSVKGESNVVGEGPLGRIAASSYAIFDDGSRAVFTGGVKARLVNQDAAPEKRP
jgi:lipopolysaccharide export system protein LptC